MSERWQDESWARTDEFWYSGKVTRRSFIGMGVAAAGALGASMLVPAPWRAAYGQAKAFKLGTLQPLSGTRLDRGHAQSVGRHTPRWSEDGCSRVHCTARLLRVG